jgi:flagellar P-ring protein precursor FlgI
MRRIIVSISCMAVVVIGSVLNAAVTVKVKDISFIDGLKENQIFGYGLVVGLQGTGDTRRSPLARASLKNLLKNLGMEGEEMTTANTAAVLLTARLPAFVRIGDRIDVTVSSIGDAKSLEGGILVQSPLRGADNVIYAAAQGPLSVPRIAGNRRQVLTVARISGGALVERDIGADIVTDNNINIVLKEWDYSLANSIIKAVAGKYPDAKPEMTNTGKIRIHIPQGISLPEFVSSIENIEVTPAYKARVVINERDGTIVTGGDVKISEAMVSREGLTVVIKDTGGKASASYLKDTATVKELVDSLNVIGASTSDIISILKALEASGALHSELDVR